MKKIIVILVLVFVATSLWGITLSNPVSVALGDAYIAKARGCEALHWNPANLGIVEHKMTFNLFQLSSDLRNSSLSLGYYNDLMDKDTLNHADKLEFMDKVPDDGLFLNANAGVYFPLSCSIGKFAFTLNNMTRSSIRLSKEYFQLVLFGNEIGETYDMEDNRGRAVSFWEIKAGYGDRIPMEKISQSFEDFPPIYAGLSFGYIMGVAYARIMEFDSQVGTTDSTLTIYNNLVIRTAGYESDSSRFHESAIFPGAGNGYRINFGLTSPITEKITASLAIKNLFGVINWTESCEEHNIRVRAFDFTIDTWNDSMAVDTTYAIDNFSQTIPVEIHLGGSFKFNKITVYTDYVQAFERSLFTSAKPKFSVGAEYYPLNWLPVRAGFGFGGGERPHYSLGSGFELGSFDFNWGVSYYTSPLYTSATGIKLSFGARLAF